MFRLNTGKYGPEITPYLETCHAVHGSEKLRVWKFFKQFKSLESVCFRNFIVVIICGCFLMLFFDHLGSELNPCDKIKRTVQNYALLSNGLLQTGASVQEVKAQHKIHKRTLKNDLRQFHDKTIKLGKFSLIITS